MPEFNPESCWIRRPESAILYPFKVEKKMSFQHLSVDELKKMKSDSTPIAVLDIRDPVSFETGHIDGAIHLTNDNVQEHLAEMPADRPVVVCCYHGNSSQPVAQWLSEQGFETVYSLDGGYSAWAVTRP